MDKIKMQLTINLTIFKKMYNKPGKAMNFVKMMKI